MSLIIALALIIIILCKVGDDKLKGAEFDRKVDAKNKEVSALENLYVDRDFETALGLYIADERNYNVVQEEVSNVLSNTEHWRHLIDGDFYLNETQIANLRNHKKAYEEMRENQRIALDIMLANRGKVSMMAFTFGYEAYVLHGHRELKESAFEYAETILNILRSRGAQVELYYYRHLSSEAYYLAGSHSYHRNDKSKGEVILEFNKDVLFKQMSLPTI